jgi:hypothetical protein
MSQLAGVLVGTIRQVVSDAVQAARSIHSLCRATLLAVSIVIALLTLSGKEVRRIHLPH